LTVVYKAILIEDGRRRGYGVAMGLRRSLKRLLRRWTAPAFTLPVSVTEQVNSQWRMVRNERHVSIAPLPIFSARDRFFTIGSCFAEEVRRALTARGMTCLPDYSRVSFDPITAKVDKLPQRQHMNFYNTYSIRQEIERVAGLWAQSDHDFWAVENRVLEGRFVKEGNGTLYQDPYRRVTLAQSQEQLRSILAMIDRAMADGMRTATAFIITLGLTEVFMKLDDGRVVNQFPGYRNTGSQAATRFHASSFAENLDNMVAAIETLRLINEVPVVLTVSPVPLQRTFSGDDVVVANQRSKAILLAVAREVCERYAHCHYFPSYEIVTSLGGQAYESDGRHVRRPVVEQIVDAFAKAFIEPKALETWPAGRVTNHTARSAA
jgi:hypothetical protein